MSSRRHDPERLIDLDLVRCTENGALAAWKWFGKGDKEQADDAASDAIRGMFSLIDCQGLVRIGEGRKDNAPGIFTGEKLGTWNKGSIAAAIALDPIDGTTPCSKGFDGAISVMAVATCENRDQDPRELFPAIPSYYMEKLAFGPQVADAQTPLNLDAPLSETLGLIAASLNKRVRDLVAVVLDRPRHQDRIEKLRSCGCGVRLIPDGDVAAAIAPCLPDSGVDLYLGIGGSPEAVLAASAIKSLGGEMLTRMCAKDENEKRYLTEKEGCTESDFEKVWTVAQMAKGDHLIFVATGISNSAMLRGIRYDQSHCITESILIRARHQTFRRIIAHHNIAQKTIRLASTNKEMTI